MGSQRRLKIGLVVTMVVGCIPMNIYRREGERKGEKETERQRERGEEEESERERERKIRSNVVF